MAALAPPAPSRWRNRITLALLIELTLLSIAFIVKLLGDPVLPFFIAVISPLIIVLWLVSRERRRFGLFVWLIYAVWCTAAVKLFAFFTEVDGREAFGGVISAFIGSDVARAVVSALLAAAIAALLVVAPIYLEAAFTAHWVLGLTGIYNITHRQATRLLLSLILNANPPVIIVEEGQIKESRPKGWPDKIGGPALVVVRPYNAVVLEQAGRITRVEGPGEIMLRLDERVKAVVDLRPQSCGFEAEQVLTRDRVPLKIKGGAGFRIQRLEDLMQNDPTPVRLPRERWARIGFRIAGRDSEQGVREGAWVHRRSVYDAVYVPKTNQTWIEKAQGDVESTLRRVIRTYDFREIYNLDAGDGAQAGPRRTILEVITEQVTEILRDSARRYGVHINGASIKTIEIGAVSNVKSVYFKALGVEWHQRIAHAKSESEAEAFTQRANVQTQFMAVVNEILVQFRDALFGAAGANPNLAHEVIQRYLQVAEHLLVNILTDQATARRYLDTMATLARVSPNTVIAAGMDISSVSDFVAAGLKQPAIDADLPGPRA